MSDCRDYKETRKRQVKHLEAKIPGLHLKVAILVKILL